MLYTAVLTIALPLLAFAGPAFKRAGGPAGSPIPSSCATTAGNADGKKPSDSFTEKHKVYQSFFETNLSINVEWQHCIKSCYGFNGTQSSSCKTAYVAYGVKATAGDLGTSGGVSEATCILYGDYLKWTDLVRTADEQYTSTLGGTIDCHHSK